MLAPIRQTRPVTLPHWFDAAVVGLVAAIALIVLVRFGHDSNAGGDWSGEAAPSVDMLLRGRMDWFLRYAPPYGGSLLMRAPFMELSRLWGATPVDVYDSGAAPCEAALVGLGLWLAARLGRRGCSLLARCTAVALLIVNPFTLTGLAYGHPEEMLGAVLCVAAVLCAGDDRAVLAGVLVGLATANKAWGVLAAGPVLVTLSRHRPRALLAMIVAAGAILLPFAIARTGGVVAQANAVGAGSGGLFQPWQLWWFLGHHPTGPHSYVRIAPTWLGSVGHTLPIALMPPLTVVFGRRDRGDRRANALLLLALLLLLRCALDPWDISYYATPFLAALLTWECVAGDRPPTVSLGVTAVAWFALQGTQHLFGDNARDAIALVYLVCAVPAILVLGGRVLGPPWRLRPQL